MAKNVVLATDIKVDNSAIREDFKKFVDAGGFKTRRVGTNVRLDFSKIPEKLEMPNLIEVQKNSYEWFITDGIKEVFEEMPPVVDYSENLVLEFLEHRLEKTSKYSNARKGTLPMPRPCAPRFAL